MPSYDYYTDSYAMNHHQPSYQAVTMMTPKKDLCVVNVQPDKQTKNRRKRTQASDKAILESAYQSNAKPDKAARLAIVRQVSMTEKEVQIWFQNRRQNDRRKSRPLSAQEIAALRYGGMQVISSESASPEIRNALQAACLGTPAAPPVPRSQHSYPGINPLMGSPTQVGFPAQTPTHMAHSHLGATASPMPSLVDSSPLVRGGLASASGAPVCNITSSPEHEIRTPCNNATNRHHPMMHNFPSSAGVDYVSNRWNTNAFSSPSGPGVLEDPKPLIPNNARILPEPLSKVRLAYSLEGRAEITNDMSPPRLHSPERHNISLPECKPLDRNNSDASGIITLPPISSLTRGLPPGRSRDVRQWESCCDKDTPQNDQLTEFAMRESSGSALAEISLRRSTSGLSSHHVVAGNSGALQINTAKRNMMMMMMMSPVHSGNYYTTPRYPNCERPRAYDDYSTPVRREERDVHHPPRMHHSNLAPTASPAPSGPDSDKENHQPEMIKQTPATRRVLTPESPLTRRSPSPMTRPLEIIAARDSPLVSKKRSRKDEEEDDELEKSEPPRKRAAREDVNRYLDDASPSKKGDAVCVAGLLALREGNWR